MTANVPKKSWLEQMELYSGYGSKGYRGSDWVGDTALQKGFSEKYKIDFDTEMPGIPEWRLK